MIINDELITRAIERADKDQYGQVPTFEKTIGNLFPSEDKEMIREFLKTSKKYRLSTYGWRYGTYEAICLR